MHTCDRSLVVRWKRTNHANIITSSNIIVSTSTNVAGAGVAGDVAHCTISSSFLSYVLLKIIKCVK